LFDVEAAEPPSYVRDPRSVAEWRRVSALRCELAVLGEAAVRRQLSSSPVSSIWRRSVSIWGGRSFGGSYCFRSTAPIRFWISGYGGPPGWRGWTRIKARVSQGHGNSRVDAPR
jgi:hypothetical protein